MTNRRDVLKALAVTPLAALTWSREDVDRAAEYVDRLAPEAQQTPRFFTADEMRLVRVLVDDIIPRDARSGSATDARVPEFMDFMLSERSANQQRTMREGLTWLNAESQARFSRAYADAPAADRHRILNDIAWPARAPEALRQRATWFNSVRDLTASGFFSSRVGYGDLRYTGNAAIPRWTGSTPAQMEKLGLTYAAWDRKYGRGY